MNVKYTLAQTKEARRPLELSIRDPQRSAHAPNALERDIVESTTVRSGILAADDYTVRHWNNITAHSRLTFS